MQSDILVNADPAVLHWIEFVAGTSNDIVLSRDKVVLAKAMLKEAEQHSLEKEESLEVGLRVERLRVALAPHKSVPAEILGIIFRYSSMILCVCTFALKYDPLTFSHVCSRWRTICRSEPSFWNRAFFLLGQRDDLNLIEFWMDNLVIDSHPLSLSIKGHSDFDPESLKLILSRHSLIRHLETQEVEHFLGMPIQSFPLLENLYISLDSRKFPLVFRSPCFVGMENLRNFTVRFSGPADESMFTQTTLPWGCLTSLTIRFSHKDYFLTIPQAVELLKQCTNLRKCSICVKNASAPSLLTVHLPHLTDLYFVPHRSVHENPFSLAYCLITPVLKSLSISVVMSKTFDDVPAGLVKPDIGHVVRHAGCSLHTLHLRDYTALSVDVDLELELLPYLHTLEAPTVIISDETIDKIAQEILLPNIQTLTVAIYRIESIGNLAKLVETKSSSSTTVSRILCLTVIVLQQPEAIAKEKPYICACLKRIEACGSKLVLREQDTGKDIII